VQIPEIGEDEVEDVTVHVTGAVEVEPPVPPIPLPEELGDGTPADVIFLAAKGPLLWAAAPVPCTRPVAITCPEVLSRITAA